MTNKEQSTHDKQGFTLIEVIVSLGLFAVVMTIALGALFMVIAANRQAKAIKLVVNNVNIAMEGMTRELRVGYDYCAGTTPPCNDTSPGGSQIVYFTTDDNGKPGVYRLNSQTIQRNIDNAGWYDLTGSDVKITALNFYIQGTTVGDRIQPFITIVVRGEIQVGDLVDDFQLQSTISQRKLSP